MVDVAEIESRLKKAQAKAERARQAHEAASSEVMRLETTLSVVREMLGSNASPSGTEPHLTPRQSFVFNALKIGRNDAMSPVEVYQVASNQTGFKGDVNYVRTTLWRMADKGHIEGADGKYWRFPLAFEPFADDAINESLDQQAAQGGRDPWDEDDLDSEIPF